MPAPDLPPPPPHAVTDRPLAVHLHPDHAPPEALRDRVVVVIDQLRATVTMTAALFHGAAAIVPTLTVEAARAAAAGLPPASTILGGERGGVLIPGFHTDNSPLRITPALVRGKTLVFTTTNGTASLLHARHAAAVFLGSLANLSALCEMLARDPRPVHILCAGTRDEVSLDDVLPAGAMVERLTAAGRQLVSDDSARLALYTWRGASANPGGVRQALLESRGGRNLHRLGLAADVDFCAQLDTLPIVPRFDAETGRITA